MRLAFLVDCVWWRVCVEAGVDTLLVATNAPGGAGRAHPNPHHRVAVKGPDLGIAE